MTAAAALVVVATAAAIHVASDCPACRADVHDRRHILIYKRSSLCPTDQATYDAADHVDRQHTGGRR